MMIYLRSSSSRPRWRRQGASVAALALLAFAFHAGCRSPFDSVQVVLDRHARAIEKLPEEEQARLMPYGMPVVTERADDLLPTGEVTLPDARTIAVRANPDIHAAYARLDSARARIAEARARYYPVVSFSHTSTRTFQTPANRNRLNTLLQPQPAVPTDVESTNFVTTALISALRRPFFGDESPKGDRNSFSEHSTALTATWTLFDGFVREAQIMSAKHLYRASEASLGDVQRLIVQAVDTAYFQAQLAQEQIRIARADESFSHDQLEETEKLRAAGRATQADVDNFRVRVLAAQADVTAANGLLETARVMLAELMGLSDAVLPQSADLSRLAEESAEEMAPPDPTEWIQRAAENRPDVREMTFLVSNATEELRAVHGLYMPTVTMSGSWGYDRSSNLRYTREDQSSAAALEFRWDLFTGGARRARVHAAQGLLAEAEARMKRLRLSVSSQVRQAVIALVDTQEQIRLQRETLEMAGENRRIIQAAYVAGKENLTRLNETQRDYIATDANLALARIRLRQAWTDLHAAVATHQGPAGTLTDEDPPEPGE